MRGLGFQSSSQGGRPRVAAVLVERDAAGDLQVTQVFSHVALVQEDLPLQLANLRTAVASRLQNLEADAAVVRAMDYFGSTNRGVLQRHSLVAGVLVAEVRARYEDSHLLTGREAAMTLGTTKAQLEVEARALVAMGLVDACGAALAALHLAENP